MDFICLKDSLHISTVCPCMSENVCQMTGFYLSEVWEKSETNILKEKIILSLYIIVKESHEKTKTKNLSQQRQIFKNSQRIFTYFSPKNTFIEF